VEKSPTAARPLPPIYRRATRKTNIPQSSRNKGACYIDLENKVVDVEFITYYANSICSDRSEHSPVERYWYLGFVNLGSLRNRPNKMS
jgi:hypothetical protein